MCKCTNTVQLFAVSIPQEGLYLSVWGLELEFPQGTLSFVFLVGLAPASAWEGGGERRRRLTALSIYGPRWKWSLQPLLASPARCHLFGAGVLMRCDDER